jgi:SET domain-containing protein
VPDFIHHQLAYCLSFLLVAFSIDARHNERLGRFLNDARRTDEECNCYAKSLFICGQPRVLIFAGKDIKAGSELRYDYGGQDLPWREVCSNIGT